MIYKGIYINRFDNTGSEPRILHDIIRLNSGADHRFAGAGADISESDVADRAGCRGRQVFCHERELLCRARHGRGFCAIGARTAMNPFNHPVDWLASTNSSIIRARLIRSRNTTRLRGLSGPPICSTSRSATTWTGHNVSALSGFLVADGAVDRS